MAVMHCWFVVHEAHCAKNTMPSNQAGSERCCDFANPELVVEFEGIEDEPEDVTDAEIKQTVQRAREAAYQAARDYRDRDAA